MQSSVTRRIKVGLLCALALGLTACATPTQVSLDAEVKRLCAIDGGIKVYETVKLPADKFDKYGVAHIPPKEKAQPTDEYFYEWDVYYYKQSEEAAMWRSRQRIIRRSDGKTLGESIRYSRRGGDVPGPWHPSSFSCPAVSRDQPGLEASIFMKGDAK